MELLSAIKMYANNTKFTYKIVLGKKQKVIVLFVNTTEDNFLHVAGFHYLKSIPELNRKSSKVLQSFLDDTQNDELINKVVRDSKYIEIADRAENIGEITGLLEKDFEIYKWKREDHPYSLLKADYFVNAKIKGRRFYIFLASVGDEFYVVDSFSPQERVDYTVSIATKKKMKPISIIYKKRIDNVTGEEIVYLDKMKK